MKCMMCSSKEILLKKENEKIKYKNKEINVLIEFSQCSKCSYEFVATEQIKNNDKKIIAAKRELDRYLSPEEVLHIRTHLGLTQAQAAEIFGGGTNAFSKYERGEVTQSKSMDTLLRIYYTYPKLIDSKLKSVELKKSAIKVYSIQEWKENEVEASAIQYLLGVGSVNTTNIYNFKGAYCYEQELSAVSL